MLPEAKRCSDAVFLRRACLTVAGRLPDLEEARAFLKDTSKDKRSRLIDRLLASEEFADLLTMRFADMLRIKSEFPINLWPNAVQLWHRRIRSDLLAGRSYRDMAREMLTASGSNFRVPHANFFRASADRSPEGLAKIAAQTFLGIRLEDLSPEQRKEFALFSAASVTNPRMNERGNPLLDHGPRDCDACNDQWRQFYDPFPGDGSAHRLPTGF